MSHAVCLACGAREFGTVFWRIRSSTGSHLADRSSLHACQVLLKTYSEAWARGARIYRVTRKPKVSPIRSNTNEGNDAKCALPAKSRARRRRSASGA